MRFAALGALEVSADDGPLPLGGRKQRTLLAVLLLHANRAVSRDQLLDALWPEQLPPSAAESLDTYVYRLRKLLGHDRLTRAAGGYVLRVNPGELDVAEFEALARDHPAHALALWRGPAWADMLDLPLASADAQRLEELRLAALEARLEAELAAGDGPELVPELESLLAVHPLRERLVGALMVALYRAGRQTDALDAFGAFRGRLVDELGLEPGPELHELQRRILEHDPTLADRSVWPGARRSRRRRGLVVVVAVLVGAVVAGALLLRTDPTPSLAGGMSGVLALDPGSGHVRVATALMGAPAAVASGAGSVWAVTPGDGVVLRVDPDSGAVVDRIPVSGDPASIASGAGSIWVAGAVGAAVARINPGSETVTQTIPLGGATVDALAFGAGRLWIADSAALALHVIDPATGARRTVALDVRPSALAFGAGALWVAAYHSAEILKLSATSGRVLARLRVGNGPAALAFADGELWVANRLDSTVSRIDGRRVRTIAVAGDPSAVSAAGGSIWVANEQSGSVVRIDPRRGTVTESVAVGGRPTSLVAAGGRVWVGVAASPGGHRGGTFVIASIRRLQTVDPAIFASVEPPQFLGLAYDTLVTFNHTGGADGLQLVPDLALTLPAVRDGGRTYVFRLRPGIRYSDGHTVRAGDFRRAVERLFTLRSLGSSAYAGISGAAACSALACDLSRGIVTDDGRGTVVFHLKAPDPEFLYGLTLGGGAPVPPRTPGYDAGPGHPIPGTGPYRIARADRRGFLFVRNRFFREWSHAAQPQGNPDRIAWRIVSSQRAATKQVRQGRADWLDGVIPRPDYDRLAIAAPTQLHSNREFDVEFLQLNTRFTPFDSLSARRALNYATDRDKIARLYGGPALAVPTCQPLAPGLPGYRRYCPYTTRPTLAGAYAGPDLAHARRLVARSGTRAAHVNLWVAAQDGFTPPGLAPYIARVLRSLGYRTRIHLMQPGADDATGRRHLAAAGWLADYPHPSSYLPVWFACPDNHFVCDHALDQAMRRADRLESTAPTASHAVWTTIDHRLTDRAYWLPTVNLRQVDLVSPRVRDYQYNPVWGFLLDQSRLR